MRLAVCRVIRLAGRQQRGQLSQLGSTPELQLSLSCYHGEHSHDNLCMYMCVCVWRWGGVTFFHPQRAVKSHVTEYKEVGSFLPTHTAPTVPTTIQNTVMTRTWLNLSSKFQGLTQCLAPIRPSIKCLLSESIKGRFASPKPLN